MRELGIDLPQTKEYFSTVTSRDTWVHVRMEESTPEEWLNLVSLAVRRCYISDDALRALRDDRGLTVQRAVSMQIPDPGAVMSGDYAEILAALYLAATSEEPDVHLAKKWRCKNDRTKAAPKSDVVEISLPCWPNATSEDSIHCAEVKAKATKSSRSPVIDALTDSRKDQNGRLDKTLVWLEECSYKFDLGVLDTNRLNRFIEAVKHPQSTRDFYAIAVVDSRFIDNELANIATTSVLGCTLIIIEVPDLRKVYTDVYNALGSLDLV